MKQFYPNKFIYSGDIAKAKTMFGPGKSQMNILKQFNSFQDLNQGIRKIWLDDYSYVECRRIYNQNIIKIHVIPEDDSKKETFIESKYLLLLVYGDGETKLEIANKTGDYELEEEILYPEDSIGVLKYISGNNLLYGGFGGVRDYGLNVIGETSEAISTLSACLKRHYQRKYEEKEKVIGDYKLIENEILKNIHLNTALDISPVGNQLCEDVYKHVLKEWTKTYDDLIICVYMYFDHITLLTLWGVTASYKNHPVTINKKPNWDGMLRQRPYESSGATSNTHMGFDIWKENDVYHLGIMADSGYFISLSLNETELNFEEEFTCNSNVHFNEDLEFYSFNENIRLLHIFLLGYGHVDGHDYAWWGMPSFGLGSGFSPYYYRENLLTGELTEFQIDTEEGTNNYLVSALWHPIERKLYVLGDSGYLDTETGDSGFAEYQFMYFVILHPESGFACYYGPEADTKRGSYQCPTAPYPECTTTDEDTFAMIGDIKTWDSIAIYNKASNYPGTYDISTSYRGYKEIETSVKEYGALLIDDDIISKGKSQSFSCDTAVAHLSPGELTVTYQGNFFYIATTEKAYTECRPNNVKRYDFKKWLWDNNGGIVYEYLVDQMTTEENNEGDIICVWEDVWTSVTSGSSKILDGADFNFPYDFNWEAILLSGTDSNNTLHETDTIYIDSNDDFFTQDSYGQIYEIGKYERAFFTQYDLDIEKEI